MKTIRPPGSSRTKYPILSWHTVLIFWPYLFYPLIYSHSLGHARFWTFLSMPRCLFISTFILCMPCPGAPLPLCVHILVAFMPGKFNSFLKTHSNIPLSVMPPISCLLLSSIQGTPAPAFFSHHYTASSHIRCMNFWSLITCALISCIQLWF